MNGTAFLHMLFGAALVAIGVLSAALADRIRGLRISRDGLRAGRAKIDPTVIPVAEPAELVRPAVARRAARGSEPKPQADGSDDVIAALVASGYKKHVASEAAWACTAADRATIESWTRAALRAAARGGMS